MRLVACPSCHIQYDVSSVRENRFRCSCGVLVENVETLGRDARARRCGACGAAIESEARECPYCRAAILSDATRFSLICPECFVRNDELYLYCIQCGVEFRPQPVPGATEDISCPACGDTLKAQGIGGVPVQECGRCAGLWVPGEHFDALVKRAMEAARSNPMRGLGFAPKGPTQATSSKVQYRRCPECDQPMHRKNFGRRSGTILDSCGDHGTWLDAKELEQVAEFVLSGGLEKAELQRLEDAKAQLKPQGPWPTEGLDAWMSTQSAFTGEALPPARSQHMRDLHIELGTDTLGSFLRALLGK